MSTNNNKLKQRQKVREFEANYTVKVNPYQNPKSSIEHNPNAQQELSEKLNKARTRDFLSKYLEKVYAQRGIGFDQLNHFISLYLRDLVARDPTRSSKQLGTDRGNIMKEIYRGTMTWNNFIGKLRLIRIRDIKFTVEITDDRGHTTIHTAPYRDSTIPMAMGLCEGDVLDDDDDDNVNDMDDGGFEQ